MGGVVKDKVGRQSVNSNSAIATKHEFRKCSKAKRYKKVVKSVSSRQALNERREARIPSNAVVSNYVIVWTKLLNPSSGTS